MDANSQDQTKSHTEKSTSEVQNFQPTPEELRAAWEAQNAERQKLDQAALAARRKANEPSLDDHFAKMRDSGATSLADFLASVKTFMDKFASHQ